MNRWLANRPWLTPLWFIIWGTGIISFATYAYYEWLAWTLAGLTALAIPFGIAWAVRRRPAVVPGTGDNKANGGER